MLNNFLKRLITAICLLVFLHIEATWLLKFSRSSMCTPSNLQVVEGSINVPSTEKCKMRLIFPRINGPNVLIFSKYPVENAFQRRQWWNYTPSLIERTVLSKTKSQPSSLPLHHCLPLVKANMTHFDSFHFNFSSLKINQTWQKWSCLYSLWCTTIYPKFSIHTVVLCCSQPWRN